MSSVMEITKERLSELEVHHQKLSRLNIGEWKGWKKMIGASETCGTIPKGLTFCTIVVLVGVGQDIGAEKYLKT